MTKKQVHITHRPDGWAAKSIGAARAAGLFERKQDAVNAGRQIAQNKKAELVIHRKDGTIQDKDSFGNDPFPPLDRVH